MRKSFLLWAPVLALLCGCLALAGCGETRSPYEGTYRTEQTYAGKGHIELVLKDSGECTWKLENDSKTLKLKWRVEGNQIWIYTREGAIMIATISEGGKRLSVDMTGDWHPSCPVNQCLTFVRVAGAG